MNILFVHLYNDYSGSPRVLSDIVDAFDKKKINYNVITSNTNGFIKTNNKSTFSYKWSANKYITLMRFIYAQLYIFLYTLINGRKYDVIYINTILPFSAAIAGKILGKNVIYHVHEVSVNPPILSNFLKYIFYHFSDKAIFVSKYVSDQHSEYDKEKYIVYNSTNYCNVKNDRLKNYNFKRILLVSSLKKYKGVLNFLAVSKLFESDINYKFNFITNASDDEIDCFFKDKVIPSNFIIYNDISDLTEIYSHAYILLNLSIPSEWIETFGLTIIEAMAFGVPSIAPFIGGPCEIVRNGIDGFCCDPENINTIKDKINTISNDYSFFSKNCLNRIKEFSPDKFANDILKITMRDAL